MPDQTILLPGAVAGADLSTAQFLVMQLSTGASFEVNETTLTTDRPVGILQNNPNTSGDACEVVTLGIAKAEFGGTVNLNMPLGTGTDARLVEVSEGSSGSSGLFVIAHSLEAGTSGGVYKVMVVPPHISWAGT